MRRDALFMDRPFVKTNHENPHLRKEKGEPGTNTRGAWVAERESETNTFGDQDQCGASLASIKKSLATSQTSLLHGKSMSVSIMAFLCAYTVFSGDAPRPVQAKNLKGVIPRILCVRSLCVIVHDNLLAAEISSTVHRPTVLVKSALPWLAITKYELTKIAQPLPRLSIDNTSPVLKGNHEIESVLQRHKPMISRTDDRFPHCLHRADNECQFSYVWGNEKTTLTEPMGLFNLRGQIQIENNAVTDLTKS